MNGYERSDARLRLVKVFNDFILSTPCYSGQFSLCERECESAKANEYKNAMNTRYFCMNFIDCPRLVNHDFDRDQRSVI